MKRRVGTWLLVLLACGTAQLQTAGLPLWAYGYIALPASPGD